MGNNDDSAESYHADPLQNNMMQPNGMVRRVVDADGSSRLSMDPNGSSVSATPETQTIAHENEVHFDSNDHDIWSRSEGYTPLSDIQDGGAGGFMRMMAAPPEIALDDDDELKQNGGGGAFFVGLAAFGPTVATAYQTNDDEEEDDWDNDLIGKNGKQLENVDSENYRNLDYLSVAERAISMLDDEYAQTLRLEAKAIDGEDIEQINAAISTETSAPVNTAPSLFAEDQVTAEEAAPVGIGLSNEIPDVPKATRSIDTDAVRRAVQTINLRDPSLARNTNQWHERFQQQQQQQQQRQYTTVVAPPRHAIIPHAPLQAFRKRTAKAVQATSNLTRCATLAEGLYRVLWNPKREVAFTTTDETTIVAPPTKLIVHVVGVDHVECSSSEQTLMTFGPLARWIGATQMAPQDLELHLVGPNIPPHNGIDTTHCSTASFSVNLMPATTKLSLRNGKGCLQRAEAFYHCASYHEWWSQQRQQHGGGGGPEVPHLIICFNAGMWGYKEWRPTLQLLCNLPCSIPLIATAYTLQEAEEDWDVIRDEVHAAYDNLEQNVEDRCLWNVEANPFASKQVRSTATALPGREYRENAAWHAWRLGRATSLGYNNNRK